ncbi:alpha/beta hydrolase [Candidatus Parcubacteria bacterium]|nr:alpha/beta hydrolase [Candidatus Parcubacteria bacterium]
MHTSNNSKINVILIHGKDTDPTKKWYPWLKKEVEKKGVKFIAPKLPKAEDPVLIEWLNEIENSKPDENTIFVGHSRGGVAILRWIEKLPENKKIKKVILVAANNPAVSEKNQKKDTHGFYELGEYNFEKIKHHCNNFVVLHSKDDEWVPFSAGEENAKGLNAKFLKFNNRGHFGKKLPKQEISELLNEILKEI